MTTFIFAALFLLISTKPAAAQEGIQWYKDLKQATAAAQRANLPMFIDFWADWCDACKFMDADVYPDPQVIQTFKQKVIGVRIHFDLQQEVARKYKVEALPYLVFTNSYGTPLLTYRGLMEAEDLIEGVNAMPSLSEINRLDLILQKNKNHVEALEAMGDQLRMIGFFQTSIEYYERAIKTSEIKRDAAKRESMMIAIGSSYLELQAGEQAVSVFERILKEFPRSEKRAELLLGQARGYYFDGNDSKAQQLLRSIMEEYPNSETAKTAQQLLAEP